MFDLIVAGGTVVVPSGAIRADVGVIDGRIEAIGPDIGRHAGELVDADGLLVLPGVIDAHTHLRLPTEEQPNRFRQDTTAAAMGGTTTVLTFNNPGTGISEEASRSPLRARDEFIRRTTGESAIDYGLCSVLSGLQDDPIGAIPDLIRSGVPTFKAFMVYDFRLPDEDLERSLRVATTHGGRLQVHCEEPALIEPLIQGALGRGDVGPRHHVHTRPPAAEAAATRKAIDMARRADASVYIVHLSCAEALEAVADAKSRGEPVYAETCPQYLTLTDALYDDPDDAEVIKRVISPPLRSGSDVAALWAGLRDGLLDVVGSDHVPDRLDTEKRVPCPPFTEISNGGPGIETLLSVVYSEGVERGRIGVKRLAEVLSANPARLFGLPTKGSIAVGKDADLVMLDPGAQRTLRQAQLHHTSDFTPYEGLAVAGEVRTVLLRGRRIADASAGRYLPRTLS